MSQDADDGDFAPPVERRQSFQYHWLDSINDFLLNEWIRDYIWDFPNTPQLLKGIIEHYNATNNQRIRQRLYGVYAEIQKQDAIFESLGNTPNTTDNEEKKEDTKEDTERDEGEECLPVNKDNYDELTPADYLQKQAKLLNTKEYKDIKGQFEKAMRKLLKDKSNQDLARECDAETCCKENKDAEICTECECVKRIKIVLLIYSKLMHCDGLWRKVPIGPLVTYDEGIKYSHQHIFNDFLHIKLCHIDADDHTKKTAKFRLFEHFEQEFKCEEIHKCHAFSRHFRDRGDLKKEKLLFHLIQAYHDTKSKKLVQDKQDIEFIFQEQCDTIHCYFLHSTEKYANDEKDESKANERIDDITQHGLGRSWQLKEKNESKEAKKVLDFQNVQDVDVQEAKANKSPRSKSKKAYVGKKEDETWLDRWDCKDKDDENGYQLLVKYMGIFRWQSAYGFRTGQNRGLVHLKAKFKNVKDEALLNSYARASKDNWNQTLRKSKIFFNSFARNRIKTLYAGSFKDDVSDTHITWRPGEEVKLQDVLMLKLYTDFDKLQHELKKCFRWESIRSVLDKMQQNNDEKEEQIEQEKQDNAKKQELEKRLCEFFHWRVGLLIVLNKYGKKINENNMVLYHGVNAKMILNPAETMAFYGPLSTTASYHVAKTFATAKGMVLKITSQYPRLDFCRAFDASLISDYPEEREYLIGFVYMRVLEIRTRPIIHNIMDRESWDDAPLASKIRVVFFAIHLFREQMFSMSQHLEYYLIEFLKCNQMNCCKTYDKDSVTKEIKESFLSFLCCMCAEHKGRLTEAGDWSKSEKEIQIMKILWNKFKDFQNQPNIKQVVKIDQISNGLKPFFLEKVENKDVHKNDKYLVSFAKLLNIFPNVEIAHFINDYRFDDDVLTNLLSILRVKNEKIRLKKVTFVYYNYAEANNPATGDKFFHPNDLKEVLRAELESCGWKIKSGKNGKIGFKIRLYNYAESLLSRQKSVISDNGNGY